MKQATVVWDDNCVTSRWQSCDRDNAVICSAAARSIASWSAFDYEPLVCNFLRKWFNVRLFQFLL